MKFIPKIVSLFPLWAVLFSGLAYLQPEFWSGFKPQIVPLLGVVMFGMGLTLRPRDFSAVFKRPKAIGIGTLLQFAVMPFAAWIISKILGLPPQLMAGMVLVGSCPGGTASNVVCYLARGDVALSITLTAVSTILAVLVTPLLTWFYVGQSVQVDIIPMLLSILKIVLIPVVLGVTLNHFLHFLVKWIEPLLPLISVMAIVVIIAIVVALNSAQLQTMGLTVAAAVVLHNLSGLAAGYGLSKLFGFTPKTCRTLAIEVGMQNSGLGVTLATQFFSAAAALPGALFSIWHNLSGSALAAYWSRKKAA